MKEERSLTDTSSQEIQHGTIGLLVFNKNQSKQVLHNLQILEDIVDEIVIVDSSSFEEYQKLTSVPLKKCSVYHVLPVGYADPLRMYGLSKIRTDFVFYLDADEVPCKNLVSDLRTLDLTSSDAFAIKRIDFSMGAESYHVRLYKKRAVSYKGIIHEQPIIKGKTCKLDPSYYITHLEDELYYSNNSEKFRRYSEIEAFCRPFPFNFMPSTMRKPSLHAILRSKKIRNIVRDLFVNLWLLRACIKYEDIRTQGYVLAGWKEHLIASYDFFASLPAQDQEIVLDISRDVQRQGVIKYLHLDDPTYVDQLSLVLSGRQDGLDIFKELLKFRHFHGRHMEIGDVRLSLQQ